MSASRQFRLRAQPHRGAPYGLPKPPPGYRAALRQAVREVHATMDTVHVVDEDGRRVAVCGLRSQTRRGGDQKFYVACSGEKPRR